MSAQPKAATSGAAYTRPLPFVRRASDRRIEVFSPKLGRRLSLTSYAAWQLWLALEANPEASTFCERPAFIAGTPRRTIDFWVRFNRQGGDEFWLLDARAGRPRAPGPGCARFRGGARLRIRFAACSSDAANESSFMAVGRGVAGTAEGCRSTMTTVRNSFTTLTYEETMRAPASGMKESDQTPSSHTFTTCLKQNYYTPRQRWQEAKAYGWPVDAQDVPAHHLQRREPSETGVGRAVIVPDRVLEQFLELL